MADHKFESIFSAIQVDPNNASTLRRIAADSAEDLECAASVMLRLMSIPAEGNTDAEILSEAAWYVQVLLNFQREFQELAKTVESAK
ncbi:MAG: hypothetical protein HUJ28_09295 [Chromatiales bacterium]|nr:hypothetical protein [Chromatiales bacterium]